MVLATITSCPMVSFVNLSETFVIIPTTEPLYNRTIITSNDALFRMIKIIRYLQNNGPHFTTKHNKQLCFKIRNNSVGSMFFTFGFWCSQYVKIIILNCRINKYFNFLYLYSNSNKVK